MKTGSRNNTNALYRIRCRLAADKKKAVTAVCLVLVMIFMWARVLLKKGPQEAGAVEESGQVNSVKEEKQKVKYLELPKIPGRNDVITRDFFVPAGWLNLNTDKQNSTDNRDKEVVSDGSEKLSALITGSLQLKVVLMGQEPSAFINNKFVFIGDKLSVSDKAGTYECEVIRIEEDRVVIRYEKVEVVIKIQGVLK